MCWPGCPAGYKPDVPIKLTCSDVRLGGVTEYVFDAKGSKCIPRRCTAGPTADVGGIDFTNCQGATGNMCSPNCTTPGQVLHGADQQPTSTLQLVCEANGMFDASSVHCARPANPSCEGGPINGTKHTGCDACTSSFTQCDSVLSNQQCFVQWKCAEGYTAPEGAFKPQCDAVTNQLLEMEITPPPLVRSGPGSGPQPPRPARPKAKMLRKLQSLDQFRQPAIYRPKL